MPSSSSIRGRSVSHLRLHTVFHIDGAGQTATDIFLKANKYINFSMTKIDGGVLLKGDGVRGAGTSQGLTGGAFEVFVPDAACKAIQLECEE